MVEISPEAFDAIVEDAIASLPDPLRTRMDNIVISVEVEPGLDDGDVLGIYRGIDLTRRGLDYQLAMPDEIVIFQGPLTRICADLDELYDEVYITVLHEIAHHFGIDDDRLHDLGWA